MESKPRLSLRDARRLHGANGGKSAASSSSNPNARAYRIARQSGLLNLSTRSLQEFPKEILRLHELADEVRIGDITIECLHRIARLLRCADDAACALYVRAVVVPSPGRTQLGMRDASESGPEL